MRVHLLDVYGQAEGRERPSPEIMAGGLEIGGGGKHMNESMTPNQNLRIAMKGWRDGAGGKPISTELMIEEVELYKSGYRNGQQMSRDVMSIYADELGATNNPIVAKE